MIIDLKPPTSTEQKLRNLRIALVETHGYLKKEGRFVSAEHVDVSIRAVDFALTRHAIRTPGHD